MISLSSSLRRLGIPGNSVLLVHNSFRGMSREGFTPKSVIEQLAEHMKNGTLLLPTMSWRFVKPTKPEFHEIETPSNTGILTEVFRTHFATHRSLHPTHSVSGLGIQAKEMLSEHHIDPTPCSDRSPFGKLVEADGWVLMLNIGFDCCTQIHYCEETVAPNIYLRPADQAETYFCTDRHGIKRIVKLRRHLFLPRDYWQFQDQLARNSRLRIDCFGNVVCRVFRARDLNDVVLETLISRPDAILAKTGQRYRYM